MPQFSTIGCYITTKYWTTYPNLALHSDTIEDYLNLFNLIALQLDTAFPINSKGVAHSCTHKSRVAIAISNENDTDESQRRGKRLNSTKSSDLYYYLLLTIATLIKNSYILLTVKPITFWIAQFRFICPFEYYFYGASRWRTTNTYWFNERTPTISLQALHFEDMSTANMYSIQHCLFMISNRQKRTAM